MKIRSLYSLFVLLFPCAVLQANWSLYIGGENTSGMYGYTVAPKQRSEIARFSTIPTTSSPSSALLSTDGKSLYALSKNKKVIIPYTLSSPVVQEGLPIQVGGVPSAMAIAPSGKSLYVLLPSEGVLKSISFSALAPTVSAPISVGINPQALAITPQGNHAYVCVYGKPSQGIPGSLACVDLTSLSVSATLSMAPYHPFAIVMDPEGLRGYVLASHGIDGKQCVVLPLDFSGSCPVIGTTVTVPCSVFSKMVITPDGKRIFALNKESQTVVAIDNIKTSPTVLPPMYVVHVPHELTVTPDSATLFVSYEDWSTILPIDVSADRFKFGEMIFLDGASCIMAMASDDAPQAMFTAQPAPAGQKSSFSAVDSKSATGDIVKYEWDFGDGMTHTTKRETASHVYRKSGLYKVTLTVTNSSGSSVDQCYTGQLIARKGSSAARITKELFVASHVRNK